MTRLSKSIATQLRHWRDECAGSQDWLAAKSGVPQSGVSRVESGKHLPTLRTLERLARPLNAEVVVQLVRRDRSPLADDLVERIAASINDCHPSPGRHMTWADWVKDAKSKDQFKRQMAIEWTEGRRNEARAALFAIDSYLDA